MITTAVILLIISNLGLIIYSNKIKRKLEYKEWDKGSEIIMLTRVVEKLSEDNKFLMEYREAKNEEIEQLKNK